MDTMEERLGVTLLWTIENFSHCIQKERLESPHFCVEVLDWTTWYLRIYPTGCDGKNEVNVYLCSNNSSRLIMDYEIAFLSANGAPLVVGLYKNKEIIHPWGYGIPTYPTQKEVFESRKSEFLPQDTLTVRCRLWKPNKSILRPETCFARTRINVHRRSILWTVPEFNRLQLGGKGSVKSVAISVDRPSFDFELSLSGACQSHARIDIRVHKIGDFMTECYATCRISVLHNVGTVMKCVQDVHWFESKDRTWKLPYFLSRTDLGERGGKSLRGDVLRLFCEFTVTFSNDPHETESVCPVPQETWSKLLQGVSLSALSTNKNKDSLSVLQEELRSLYQDRTMSDFELRSGDVSFPVHKLVLTARSPVFKAMFSINMTEGTGNFLDIPDLEPDTLDRLLLFVYTGNVEDLKWETAYKLYYAADKYEMLTLKEICAYFLIGNITVHNVCDIVVLADMHQDEDLKTSVHEFIVLNDGKIIRSVEWKQFLCSNPVLAAETMQVVYSKKLDMKGI